MADLSALNTSSAPVSNKAGVARALLMVLGFFIFVAGAITGVILIIENSSQNKKDEKGTTAPSTGTDTGTGGDTDGGDTGGGDTGGGDTDGGDTGGGDTGGGDIRKKEFKVSEGLSDLMFYLSFGSAVLISIVASFVGLHAIRLGRAGLGLIFLLFVAVGAMVGLMQWVELKQDNETKKALSGFSPWFLAIVPGLCGIGALAYIGGLKYYTNKFDKEFEAAEESVAEKFKASDGQDGSGTRDRSDTVESFNFGDDKE